MPVQALAADADGNVANVQLLVGTSVLASLNAPPFAATTNNLAAGTYTLSAIATDNNGIKAN